MKTPQEIQDTIAVASGTLEKSFSTIEELVQALEFLNKIRLSLFKHFIP